MGRIRIRNSKKSLRNKLFRIHNTDTKYRLLMANEVNVLGNTCINRAADGLRHDAAAKGGNPE